MLNTKEEKSGRQRGHEGKVKKKKRGRPVGSTKKKSTVEAVSASTEVMIKRGRGRPRKCEFPHLNGILNSDGELTPKKARGRPRKIQKTSEESSLSCVDVSPRPVKMDDYNESDEDISGSKPRKKAFSCKRGASTSSRAENIHPIGVSPQRGWDQTGARELLPSTRETHGSQYPGWEADPAPVSWVPGEAIDSPGNRVTHWVVEEPQDPQQCPVHAEGPEQHEFREDLLRGLAELRYQLTRELAAARGEMREGAELVRTAINGVSAEIRRLCLLLQPLVTMLTSGTGMRPQQNSSPVSTMLRPQQDAPPGDPPGATQEVPRSVNAIVLQDTIQTVLQSQLDTSCGNTVDLSNQMPVPTKCPSPSPEEHLFSQSTDAHQQGMSPVMSHLPNIKNAASKSREPSPVHTPDHHQPKVKLTKPESPKQQEAALPKYQQNVSDALSCLSSIKSSLSHKHDMSTETTSGLSLDIKKIRPSGQALDEPQQDLGSPTTKNPCQVQDVTPVLLANQAVGTAVSLDDGSPNTVSYPSTSNSPLPVQDTSMLLISAAEESLGMMSQSSDNSRSAALLPQDCIQILQTSTTGSEDSSTSQALPPSPHTGNASIQSERNVALMLSQDSKSPVSLTDFPSMRSSETDTGLRLS